MKLIQADASPFARKARIIVRECNLQQSITELNPGPVTPVSNNEDVNSANPLGMIPALVLDNGDCLYDSTVICEYLNNVGNGSLYPTDAKEYLLARRMESLSDGIMDLAVGLRYETVLRPEALRWQAFIEHGHEKIDRGLDQLQAWHSELGSGSFTIGSVAVVCALGYLDFRFTDNDWRANRSELATWFGSVEQRQSIKETKPVG